MAVSKYTIQNALAFLAITRSLRGIHINTRIALNGYYDLEEYQVRYGKDEEPLTLHRYALTEAGWALARKSRLWKAHEQLVGLGFKVEDGIRTRHTPRYISYRQWVGDAERSAFTGSSGYAYAQDLSIPKGEKGWYNHEKIGQHLNG